MLADALYAISLAICSALAAEVMAWLVVYRTETYKKITAELTNQLNEQLAELCQTEPADISIEELLVKYKIKEEKLINDFEKRSRLKRKASSVAFVTIAVIFAIFKGLSDSRAVVIFPLSWIPEAVYPNYKRSYFYGIVFVGFYLFCLMLLRPIIRKRLFAATSE